MTNGEEPQRRPGKFDVWIYNKLIRFWDRRKRLGRKWGILPEITREGEPAIGSLLDIYGSLIRENNAKIKELREEIEGNWKGIETVLFGPPDFEYQQEPNSEVFCDMYRKIEYFRDAELARRESLFFDKFGTIEVVQVPRPIDATRFINRQMTRKAELEAKMREGKPLTKDEENQLAGINILLQAPPKQIGEVSNLPQISVGDVNTIFKDGRIEKMITIGQKAEQVTKAFGILSDRINHYSAAAGIPPATREPITNLVKAVNASLDRFRKKEIEYGTKLGDIASTIAKFNAILTDVVSNRPKPQFIRFAHTYKIIKPFYLKKEKEETFKIINERGEEEEVTISHDISVYLDPEDNSYTKELKEIDEKLRASKEDEIAEDIKKLEKKIEKFKNGIDEKNSKLKKGIIDWIESVSEGFLKKSDVYPELENKLDSDKLKQFEALFKNLMQKIADFSESDSKEQSKQLINEISKELSEFKGVNDEIKIILKSVERNIQSIFNSIQQAKKKIDEDNSKALQEIDDILKQIDPLKSELNKIQSLKLRKEQLESYIKESEDIKFDKRNDEVAKGLDENGWELEVFQDTDGGWYVLIDKWWVEISENDWQERTIKNKPGGEEVWRNKVENGVRRKTDNSKRYRSGYIRRVPKEFVGDVDQLDKISFISNEFDAYRDDFRDGRFHPHSKTSMDYIIAANPFVEDITKEKERAIPTKSINFPIKTDNLNTRISFRPLYYTKADTNNKSLWGTVHPSGGLGSTRGIPEDERKVSRRYNMETEVIVEMSLLKSALRLLRASSKVKLKDALKEGKLKDALKDAKTLKNQVRAPSHLNPAFDRAAIYHDYIHWGRIYYYETTEGINRWSENPFPHVTTRGFAKFMINLVLNQVFKFSDQRQILKQGEWDFGVRHYGDPFTTDPLGDVKGPGGALYHAKIVAQKKGWPTE